MASNSVGFMQGSEPSQAAAAHDFWDTVLSPTDSSPVRAPQGQRIRPAPPIEGSFVWNAGLSLQDPVTTKAMCDRYRTKEDLLGTTLTREAIRQTPRSRQTLVLRPGFREKAVTAEEKRQHMQRSDEAAAIRRRDARIQATRETMRRRREEHAAAAVPLPTVVVREQQQHPFLGSPRRVAVATNDTVDDDAGAATLAALASFETKQRARCAPAAVAKDDAF